MAKLTFYNMHDEYEIGNSHLGTNKSVTSPDELKKELSHLLVDKQHGLL